MRSVLAIGATLLATEAYAGCSVSDYKIYIPQTFVGLSADEDDSSDCFTDASVLVSKIEQWGQSIFNLSLDNFMEPAYLAAEFGNAATSLFETCATTTLAMQWADRFATLPGFLNLLATGGTAYFKNYQGVDSPLYNSVIAFTVETDCAEQSKLIGKIVKGTLNYEVSMKYLANVVKNDFKSKYEQD